MKMHTTRTIRKHKATTAQGPLQMLTCYDYQSAQMLNETSLDLILVGDSLGNVILGHETTVSVSLEEMKIFGAAVKRGAPDKFVVLDMPFGSYSTLESGLKNATELFQYAKVQALKLEGAFPYQLELIERLTQVGIPIMGHIGLTPQSVYQQGGYYTHGKDQASAQELTHAAIMLEKAGCFSVVLECVEKNLAKEITEKISIPTIGIGSGPDVDGQVLVINDLLKIGKHTPPSFCRPISDLYTLKKELIEEHLREFRG